MNEPSRKDLERLAKIAESGEIGVFEYLKEVEEKIDSVLPNVEKKLEEAIEEVKESVPDMKNILEQVKGKDGKDGESIQGPPGPPGESIVGPSGRDGKDGRDGLDGQDGKDADEDLIVLKVLAEIPAPRDGKDGSPDAAEQIIGKINQSTFLIKKERVEGLVDIIQNVAHRAIEALPVTTSFFNGIRAKNLTIEGATATQRGDTVVISGINGGATSFLDLTDTPDSYAGDGQKFVKVKATEDGLEFVAGSGLEVAWGDITGTLSDQTDLQDELDDKANIELDNLGVTAINASLLFDTDATYDIGSSTVGINDLHLGAAGVINFDGGDVTITHTANTLTFAGGTIALGTATATGGITGNLTGDVTGNVSGNAGTVTVADAGGDTTTFPLLATDATGSLSPRTDAGLTYNANTNALTATTFVGALTGNADTVTVADETSDTSSFIGFYTAASGSLGGKTNANMTFNASTGVATFGQTIVGSINGTAAVATTVTVADEATDTTCFINFTTAATGNLGVKSNTNMTFNSNTGVATFASTVLTTTDINGGTIDGTVIGGSSAAAATVTTLNTSGLITASLAGNTARFINTSDSTPVQVVRFEGDRATVADNDEAYISLMLSDDGGTQAEFARLRWLATDVNVGTSLDGSFRMALMTGGSLTNTYAFNPTSFAPSANDQASLGLASTSFSDLFLASGALINYANGDAIITHSSGILTVSTGDLRVTTAGTNSASAVTVGGTQTLTSKTLTSANVNTDIAPTSNDGATLGTTGEGWSDIYLASGGNILANNANSRRTMVLSAAGGAPTTTAGCGALEKVEYGTNDIDTWDLPFDDTTEEHAFWNVAMPSNWDGGTITAVFYWTNAGGGAAETVVWGLKGRAYADSDALDQAYGSEVTVSDTWLAQNDVHISSATGAVTIGGSPAGGQYVILCVSRKTGSDTMVGDARLLSVKISFGISSYSDN